MNTKAIRTEFDRLGFDAKDVTVKTCASAPDKLVVICDTQSCGLYNARDALKSLKSIINDDDVDVWGALDVALVEDDVADRYDV